MDICGWILESVVVREFRLAQGPATDCVTFFRNSDGSVAKIFLDDEDCTWKIEESSENPSSAEVLGDSCFEYRHRDFGREHGLIVKGLSGLLPICAECKKITDDKGYWTQIESYIRNHSEAEFSHGICPECLKELYSEYYK